MDFSFKSQVGIHFNTDSPFRIFCIPSNMFIPCFRSVENTDFILQNICEYSCFIKHPDIFCFNFIIRDCCKANEHDSRYMEKCIEKIKIPPGSRVYEDKGYYGTV